MAMKQHTFIDDYLSGLVDDDKRQTLEKLRKVLHEALPEAQEGTSYGMPAFLVNGKAVAAFLASKDHCSFFPMSGRIVAAMEQDLTGYNTSKGTIRFTPKKPLSAAVLKKAVRLRLAEIRAKQPRKATSSRHDLAVTAFLKSLKHPLKQQIEAVRKVILEANPTIQEGFKWNSMSFRTNEYFATLNWRSKDAVQLVFHLGAKVKDNTKDVKIADTHGMIRWLAKDRCLVTVGEGQSKALARIVKQWIRWVS